jgi:hypothetical protein
MCRSVCHAAHRARSCAGSPLRHRVVYLPPTRCTCHSEKSAVDAQWRVRGLCRAVDIVPRHRLRREPCLDADDGAHAAVLADRHLPWIDGSGETQLDELSVAVLLIAVRGVVPIRERQVEAVDGSVVRVGAHLILTLRVPRDGQRCPATASHASENVSACAADAQASANVSVCAWTHSARPRTHHDRSLPP